MDPITDKERMDWLESDNGFVVLLNLRGSQLPKYNLNIDAGDNLPIRPFIDLEIRKERKGK